MGKCLTPESIFHIDLTASDSVSVTVSLPGHLNLSEGEAIELEYLLHNGVEYAIAKFWHKLEQP